ncbi:MAG: helicase HerA-like domain-containing protein [Candidatus Bathyarchaeia archaeon]
MSGAARFRVIPRFSKRTLLVGAEDSKCSVFLGKLAEELSETDVWFDVEKEHVISIVGKRGSGKSYTLGCFAESLATNSEQIVRGKINRASLLFDTINIFWTMEYIPSNQPQKDIAKQKQLLEEWQLSPADVNVDVWIPAGFEIPGTAFKTFKLSIPDLEASDWCYLLGYDMFRDLGGQLILEVIDKVKSSGWTWVERDADDNIVQEKEVLPKEQYSIDDLIQCIQHDKEITSKTEGYAIQTRRAVINNMRVLSKYPLFAIKGTPLKEMFTSGKLTILLLGSVPSDIRAAIVSVFVKNLLKLRSETSYYEKALLVQAGNEKKLKESIERGIPRVTLLIDEAQNLLPSTMKTMFNEIMVKLVREGRNYGISVIMTTQQPTAIDSRVMAQVDTIISHKLVSLADLQYVTQNLKSKDPSEITYKGEILSTEELIRDLPVGYAFVSSTDVDRSFVLLIRPRVTVHGGFEL